MLSSQDLEAASGRGSEVIGTPAYMSPEQLRGQPRNFGPWTDLYAVGVMAWGLACGENPFTQELPDLFHQHVCDPLPGFHPRQPMPESLPGWIEAMMAIDPRERSQCAADAADALRALPVEPMVAPMAPHPAGSEDGADGRDAETRLDPSAIAGSRGPGSRPPTTPCSPPSIGGRGRSRPYRPGRPPRGLADGPPPPHPPPWRGAGLVQPPNLRGGRSRAGAGRAVVHPRGGHRHRLPSPRPARRRVREREDDAGELAGRPGGGAGPGALVVHRRRCARAGRRRHPRVPGATAPDRWAGPRIRDRVRPRPPGGVGGRGLRGCRRARAAGDVLGAGRHGRRHAGPLRDGAGAVDAPLPSALCDGERTSARGLPRRPPPGSGQPVPRGAPAGGARGRTGPPHRRRRGRGGPTGHPARGAPRSDDRAGGVASSSGPSGRAG